MAESWILLIKFSFKESMVGTRQIPFFKISNMQFNDCVQKTINFKISASSFHPADKNTIPYVSYEESKKSESSINRLNTFLT